MLKVRSLSVVTVGLGPALRPQRSAPQRGGGSLHALAWLFTVGLCIGSPSPGFAQDTDEDGLIDSVEELLGTDPSNDDSDGDGLLDGEEINGRRVRGQVVPLGSYGCDPLVQDIFVEIDWMADPDGDPRPAAREVYNAAVDVLRAFEASGTGIRIHFDLGPSIADFLAEGEYDETVGFHRFTESADPRKVLPYQAVLPLRPTCGTSTELSLYEIYHDSEIFQASRRNLFYYVLFAERGLPSDLSQRNSSGVVSSFDDHLSRLAGLSPTGVQVGAFFRQPTRGLPPRQQRYQLAASLLHELGHAFGFGHGGVLEDGHWDNRDNKPNYPSIMNKRYQLWGVDTVNGRRVLDFSHGIFSSVDERQVLETAGLGTLPNEHILGVLGVEHLESEQHPLNLDWNRNGEIDLLPYGRDLSLDLMIAQEPLSDHDDWGHLLRNGFDGIGKNAYRLSGGSCGAAAAFRRLEGDVDGDGSADLVLGTRAGVRVYAGDGAGGFGPGPVVTLDRQIAEGLSSSLFHPGLLDLDGDGDREIILHLGDRVLLVDHTDQGFEVIWDGTRVVPLPRDGGPDEGLGAPETLPWSFAATDTLRVLAAGGAQEAVLIVQNGNRFAVLSYRAGAGNSQGSLGRLTGADLPVGPRPNAPLVVLAGRTLRSKRATLLVRDRGALHELHVENNSVRAVRLDVDGSLPGDGDVDEENVVWSLTDEDCFQALDVDGDEHEELLLSSGTRLAILADSAEGPPRVVWSAVDSIGTWPLDRDTQMHPVQLRGDAGSELVLWRGDSLLVLGWDGAVGGFQVVTRVDAVVPLAERQGGSWILDGDQSLHIATLAGDSTASLLLRGQSGLGVIGLQGSGQETVLEVSRYFEGTLAGWPLLPEDSLDICDLDGDEYDELVLQHGDRVGTIRLAPELTELVSVFEVVEDAPVLRELPRFLRGDTNGDGDLDLSDVIIVLQYLFQGRARVVCEKAADYDDSGELDIADGIGLLNYLFMGGRVAPPPGVSVPGIDPTPDDLRCAE